MRLGNWKISKDNELIVNPLEMRQLKTRRHLTDRTLHVECPQYPVCDGATARAIAVMALSDAAIGGCGKILVKGPRWQYEFDTKALNNGIRRKWGKRMGMFQNPLEKITAGCFYDETRKLWSVPQGFQKREEVKYPTP